MPTVDGVVVFREMPVVEIEVGVNCAPEEGDRVTLIWGSGDRATLDMLRADVAEMERENDKLRQELADLRAACEAALAMMDGAIGVAFPEEKVQLAAAVRKAKGEADG